MSRRNPQSPEEKALLQRAQRYLPGAQNGNSPSSFEDGFIVKEGRGSRIYDYSGNEYIDYLMGSGPLILGHAHPAVVEAVRQCLERGSTYFLTSGVAIELAEEMCRAVPYAEMVRFTTSGTDATFQCLRAARAYRRRDKVLKFEGGYHGSHDYAMMSAWPSQLADFPTSVSSSAGIPRVVQETVLVTPFNDLEATTRIIRKYHDQLAGVILEPLQRIIPPAQGFLEGLREVTASYDIPLIFDEVVTGFRLAYGGAQESYGVQPDMAAIGKVVGGGYPLAAPTLCATTTPPKWGRTIIYRKSAPSAATPSPPPRAWQPWRSCARREHTRGFGRWEGGCAPPSRRRWTGLRYPPRWWATTLCLTSASPTRKSQTTGPP